MGDERVIYDYILRTRAVDGKIADLSGANITNAHTAVQTGKGVFGGDAIYFDGSSYLTGTPLQQIGTDDFTISAWFNVSTRSQDYSCLIAFVPTGGTYEDWFEMPLGALWVTQFGTTWVGSTTNFTSSAYQNKWTHYAIVRNNGIVSGYINGVKIGSSSLTKSYILSEIVLGYLPSSYDNTHFNGYMDDICVIKGKAVWTDNFTPPY